MGSTIIAVDAGLGDVDGTTNCGLRSRACGLWSSTTEPGRLDLRCLWKAWVHGVDDWREGCASLRRGAITDLTERSEPGVAAGARAQSIGRRGTYALGCQASAF